MRALVSICAAGLLLAACSAEMGGGEGEGGSREGRGDRPEPVTVVETDAVRRGSVADLLTSSAVVESEASADLIPEASGVLESQLLGCFVHLRLEALDEAPAEGDRC